MLSIESTALFLLIKGAFLYNPNYLRQIIATVLQLMDMYSSTAAELLILTAAHESILGKKLCQEGGPALGLYGMEPATLFDIYDEYLSRKTELSETLRQVTGISVPSLVGLQFDPIYATAIARIHYWRKEEPLPPVGNLDALAAYAKKHWNTHAGKATPKKYLNDYRRLVLAT